MSKVAGRSKTSTPSLNSLRRRGLHTICTALSEKLSVDKKSLIQELYSSNKMEQVNNPATMNLGSVHGRVITSVSHGTSNTPVVLAAALSNIAEHSYAAKPELNANHKEKEGSSSTSSGDSSSSDSEGDEAKASAVTKEVGTGPSQAIIMVAPPPMEGVKSSTRIRSQPQKYVDEIKAVPSAKTNGTPKQTQKNTPKAGSVTRTRGRPVSARKADEDKQQKDTPDGKPRSRGRGCGKCPGCLRSDCGTCIFCKDKPKFGGPGIKKQRCANRTCLNFVKKLPNPSPRIRAIAPRTSDTSTTTPTTPASVTASPSVATPPSSSAMLTTLDIRSFIGKTPTGAATALAASMPITIASILPASPSNSAAGTGKVVAKVVSKTSTPKSTTPAVSKSNAVSAKPSTPVTKSATTPAKSTDKPTTPVAKTTTTPVAKTITTPSTKPTTPVAAKPTSSAATPAQQASTSPKKVPHSAALESLVGEITMKCVECGRERKIGMARTEKFCTQRCIINWLEANPDKNVEDAMGNVTPTAPLSITNIQSLSTSPPDAEETKKKPVSRALKNLQIDMALPGTKLPIPDNEEEESDGEREEVLSSGSGSEEGRGRKRAKLSTPQAPVITTRATRRSLGTSPVAAKPSPPATKKGRRSTQSSAAVPSPQSKSVTPVSNSSVKRGLSASVPHPPALKKVRTSTPAKPPTSTAGTSKAVTFNLGFVQNSPENQSSTPTFSLVPIDQLSGSLGSAVNQESFVSIPDDLPSNVRSWTMSQVVHYFRSSSDCTDFADLFSEQEIDGTALLLLTHEALVKCLGIKLGRAVKIMAHVDLLKHLFETKSQ